jgi:hypothetical protein
VQLFCDHDDPLRSRGVPRKQQGDETGGRGDAQGGGEAGRPEDPDFSLASPRTSPISAVRSSGSLVRRPSPQKNLSREVVDILRVQLKLSREVVDILRVQLKLSREVVDILRVQLKLSREVVDILRVQLKLSREVVDTTGA